LFNYDLIIQRERSISAKIINLNPIFHSLNKMHVLKIHFSAITGYCGTAVDRSAADCN
jgi:hypothetical protein